MLRAAVWALRARRRARHAVWVDRESKPRAAAAGHRGLGRGQPSGARGPRRNPRHLPCAIARASAVVRRSRPAVRRRDRRHRSERGFRAHAWLDRPGSPEQRDSPSSIGFAPTDCAGLCESSACWARSIAPASATVYPRDEPGPSAGVPGAYGLRLAGLDVDQLLPRVAADAPRLEVSLSRGCVTHREEEFLTDRAEISLLDGGWISLTRAGRADFTLPYAVSAEELLHPWLVPAAATFNGWFGRQVLHGGVLAREGRALAVLGEKEAGKSSLFAWLPAPASSTFLLMISSSSIAATLSRDRAASISASARRKPCWQITRATTCATGAASGFCCRRAPTRIARRDRHPRLESRSRARAAASDPLTGPRFAASPRERDRGLTERRLARAARTTGLGDSFGSGPGTSCLSLLADSSGCSRSAGVELCRARAKAFGSTIR